MARKDAVEVDRSATTVAQFPGNRRAGRPSSPVVSPDSVIEAAIDMIDNEGLNNFSIRRLARSMGVTSPTVYHHFGDRDQVLEQVVRRLVAGLRPPRQQPTWQEYLIKSSNAYRKILIDHPNAAPLLATRPWGKFSHVVVNESVRLLAGGGVPPELQLLMLRASEIVAVGSGLLAGNLDSAHYGQVDDEFEYLRTAIAGDRYDEDQTFEVICRALVTGLTAAVIDRPAARRTRRPR